MFAIQFISRASLFSASHHPDTEWQTHESERGVDYSDYASVAEAVGSLELDADGAYQYRVVEVASVEDSYEELRAENEDVLEDLEAWVAGGCSLRGDAIEALRRSALQRDKAVPMKRVSPPVAADAALERVVHRLLERTAQNDVSDEELGQLEAAAAVLDRRGVAYQGRW